MINILNIQEKRKPIPIGIASLTDFAVIPAGTTDASILLEHPNISLYCLDDEQRNMIFVETSPRADLAAHPFLYQAQYEHAQRLYAAPYETMIALTNALPAAQVPLVLIHSPGRSGSTLLSKAFQEVDLVTSLSEPDVYSQIVALRVADRTRDQELLELLACVTRLLFKPVATSGSNLWVVKFRGFCINIADLLVQAFPLSRNVFLYRHLRPWIVSMVHTAPEVDDNSMVVQYLASFVPLLAAAVEERGTPNLTLIELVTLMWLDVLHQYARLIRQGIMMYALNYDDMVANPRRAIADLFAYIGWNNSNAVVDMAIRAFSKDSQEGTIMSREAVRARGTIEISTHDWELARKLIGQYPLVLGNMPSLEPMAASVALA